MTNPTPLSPATQVMIAVTHIYQEHGGEPPARAVAAAALRAVADQLGESRAPGLEPENLYGRIVDVDDLLAIAAELEGAS